MAENAKAKAAAGLSGAAAVAFGIALALWPQQEGTSLTAYQDTGAVWTICQGHTGPEVVRGLRMTDQQCMETMRRDRAKDFVAVANLVKAPETLTVGQWVAYTDFSGNAGRENFRTSSMLRFANQGRLQESCDAFRLWTYVGKTDCRLPMSGCPGIVTRREIERKYCLGQL